MAKQDRISINPLVTALALASASLPPLAGAMSSPPQEPPAKGTNSASQSPSFPKIPKQEKEPDPISRYSDYANGLSNPIPPWAESGHREAYAERMASNFSNLTRQTDLYFIAAKLVELQNQLERIKLESDPTNPINLKNPPLFPKEFLSAEEIATGIRNELNKQRQIQPAPDLGSLLSTTIGSAVDGNSKAIALLTVRETVNKFLSLPGQPAREQIALRMNDQLSAALVNYIYDIALKSTQEDRKSKTYAQFAKGIDLALFEHAPDLFCHTKAELSTSGAKRLAKEIAKNELDLSKIRDPKLRKPLQSLINKDKFLLEIELLKIKALNNPKDPALKKQALELAQRAQSTINTKIKESIAEFAPERPNATTPQPTNPKDPSSIKLDDIRELGISVSGLGKAIGSNELLAVGTLASGSLDFIKGLDKAKELAALSKGAGALKGLSVSIDLVSTVFSVFNLLFAGPSIDEKILEQVIELRKELSSLNQQMHYEFRLVHRTMADVYTELIKALIRVEQKVEKIDDTVIFVRQQLDRIGYNFSLADARAEANLEFLASRLNAEDLKEAIKLKPGEKLSDIQFNRYLKALESAATEFSGDIVFAGTRTISRNPDDLFRTLIQEGRDLKDPSTLTGYLAQIAKEHLKSTELSLLDRKDSPQPINPLAWGNFALHYLKLVSNYPQHYQNFLKTQPKQQDPFLANLSRLGLQYQITMRSIGKETLTNALRHYIHGALEVEVLRNTKAIVEAKVPCLDPNTNWKPLELPESSATHIAQYAKTLLNSFSVPNELGPENGKRFPGDKDRPPISLQITKTGLREYMIERYPQFAVAQVLGLGNIKYSFEMPYYTDKGYVPSTASDEFGKAYDFIIGKLYIVLRADFEPNPTEGKSQPPINIFRFIRTHTGFDHFGDRTFLNVPQDGSYDVTQLFLHWLPAFRSPSGLQQLAERKQLMDHRRKAGGPSNERSNLALDTKSVANHNLTYMKRVEHSRPREDLERHWPILAQDFFKNGQEIASKTEADWEADERAKLKGSPFLEEHMRNLRNVMRYAASESASKNEFNLFAASTKPLQSNHTAEKAAEIRRQASIELNKILLPVLQRNRQILANTTRSMISQKTGDLSSAAFRMDGAKTVLTHLSHLKWADPQASVDIIAKIEGLTAIPSASEYAEMLWHRVDGRPRSLRYGWYTEAKETEMRKALLAKSDPDPKLTKAEQEKFELDITISKERAKALYDGLLTVGPTLKQTNLVSDLGIVEVTADVERAKTYRFVPNDFEELHKLYEAAKKNDPKDMLYIEPRQELLLRIVLTYRAISNLQPLGSPDPFVNTILEFLDVFSRARVEP